MIAELIRRIIHTWDGDRDPTIVLLREQKAVARREADRLHRERLEGLPVEDILRERLFGPNERRDGRDR